MLGVNSGSLLNHKVQWVWPTQMFSLFRFVSSMQRKHALTVTERDGMHPVIERLGRKAIQVLTHLFHAQKPQKRCNKTSRIVG